mgnify:CR=1 FL=1
MSPYIRHKSNNRNSKEIVFGLIERLEQDWEVADDAWKKYDYKNTLLSSPLGTIFEEYYTVIMDVNNIIEMSETKRDVLSDEWYGLIRGEALALRAFCHFEVLRMWGLAPGHETDSRILPYVKKAVSYPHLTLPTIYPV